MVKITKGKFEGLKRLSNKNGIIEALAIDQRGSIEKMLSQAKGSSVKLEDIEEFKEAVSKELTPYTSAILLDLEYGTTAITAKNPDTGLLIAYEKTGYDATEAGRLPDLIDDLSALRIKEYGANAVKLLIYYDPDEPAEINEIKHAFIERVGAECKGIDIPFFLEPVTYDSKIEDAKSIEYARIKPHKVKNTIKELTKPQYGIDVLKLEVPINLHFTEGYTDGETAYTKKEAIKHFQEAADLATLPFIYLSAGVTAERFRETIKLAAEAKTPFSGVLCGRATWQNGVKVYAEKGLQGLTEWLRTEGKQNVLELNDVLEKSAVPWWSTYGGLEKIEVK